jgi:hypothetical protein
VARRYFHAYRLCRYINRTEPFLSAPAGSVPDGISPTAVDCVNREWNHTAERARYDLEQANPTPESLRWKPMYDNFKRWQVENARATYQLLSDFLASPKHYKTLLFLEDDAIFLKGSELQIHSRIEELQNVLKTKNMTSVDTTNEDDLGFDLLSFFSGTCQRWPLRFGLTHTRVTGPGVLLTPPWNRRSGSSLYRVRQPPLFWYSYNVAVVYTRRGAERILQDIPTDLTIDMHIGDLLKKGKIEGFVACEEMLLHGEFTFREKRVHFS